MYEELENILLRRLLEKMNAKTFYINNKEHTSYDAVFTTQSGISGIIEAKVRGKKYDEVILEVEKLDHLVNAAKAKDHKILYINFFKTEDESIFDYIIFNITPRTRKWAEGEKPEVKCLFAPDKTFVNKDEKREKWVIYLKYEPDIDQKGTLRLNQK